MMKEIWKDIKGYEDLYQVSNLGNVKRIETSRNITPFTSYGYEKVDLWKSNKRHKFFVHRLVAIAFIPNPNNYPCINHKDETRTNNSIDNLEWCTHKYNLNYGTYPQRISDRLSKPIVQKTMDGEIVKIYKSTAEAERETGFLNGNICACKNGKTKSCGGFTWEGWDK